MNDRIIEIENYWARVVRDTAEFQQIADAENPEFNTVLKCLYNILKDGFINDLTENGAMRWEKILELPVSSTATLEERKVQILTYLSIRRPYTIRVLRAMLSAIMGEGNYTLNINNDTSTLTIALASTVESMREKIDELCARVIPQNLVIEYDQGLPIDYTPVEYLATTARNQGILSDIYDIRPYEITVEVSHHVASSESYLYGYLIRYINEAGQVTSTNRSGIVLVVQNGKDVLRNYGNYYHQVVFEAGVFQQRHTYTFIPKTGTILCDGVKQTNGMMSYRVYEPDYIAPVAFMGGSDCYSDGTPIVSPVAAVGSRFYRWLIKEEDKLVLNWIPALDPTGAPCMFDLVSRTPHYNSGTGDFLYPTDTAPVMTLDLDAKFYAKMTEHGIRRLYHVPKGYTGTKDEYAAEHGFKEILQPPMPLEGYWVPEWRETETQLICEWVETEPPIEEGIENE